jgi:16S rRNA (adenine1518-N6/adenine1519-N6)-dimethyltransferase
VTHSRSDITSLLEANGLAPRRAFGQNFVVDPNIVRKIARLSGVGPTDHVVEIGAGLGSLTLALAETGAHVVAVEIDNGVVEVLRDVVADLPNVEVVHADAGELDWTALSARSASWHVVANLPYNVATPLVADILDRVPTVRHLLVMVQREVADRFVAQPRTNAYGAVSVKVAFWAEARIVGDVPATVFLPKPNVASALVEFTRRDEPATRVVRTRASGLRPASQDVAPITCWARHVRAVRARRRGKRRPTRGTRRACVGPAVPGGAPMISTLHAHAKLTLSLRVTGLRTDGYHDIDAEMVSLDLHDVLTVDTSPIRGRHHRC